jgi:hypothetical protein
MGDDETARHYERRAEEVENEGYDLVLAAPRTWLALLRGEMDEVDRLEPINLGRIQHEYALPATTARLDALAALQKRSLVEREAPPLLTPGLYLEPFALRALGAVRDDDLLIEQAVDRFAAMGLEWHAEQSRKLLGPT